MPFVVRKKGNRWEIIRADTGAHVGWSDTEWKAKASARVREEAAKEKGEKLSEGIMEIEGKKYERIPDDLLEKLSGGAAAAYGVKKRDGIGYVPVGRLKALQKEFECIEEELSTGLSEEKPDMKNMSKFVRIIANKALAEEPIEKRVSPEKFKKIVEFGLLDGPIEDDIDEDVKKEIGEMGGID